MKPLADQTILVTGATDGLGRALAGELAARGATLLVHGRSEERLDEVVAELGGARAYRADFSSLSEVKALAELLLENEPRIDALVNNAGIGTGDGRRMVSQDGYELRFAVNYLAHFALTTALEPLAIARVVNVSSAGQMPIDFDDVMLEHGYSGVRAYCQSKLAQIMFTFELAQRFPAVTANALHPATYMPTKMVLESGTRPASTLEQGVRATFRLVADPALDGVSGRYYNGEREARPDPQADDPAARRRLWELSEELVR